VTTTRLRQLTLPILPVVLLLTVACGGDGETGPQENRAPSFRDPPAALAPDADLLHVVPGDELTFTAWGIDPDVEEVFYLWDIVYEDDDSEVAQPGRIVGADSAQMTWTVGSLEAGVRVLCTISDAAGLSLTRSAGSFSPGTPLRNLVVASDSTFTVGVWPYVVLGDLRVQAGATLRLQAGVELLFRPDRSSETRWDKHALIVEGELICSGELTNPVLLSGAYGSHPGNGNQQFEGIEVRPGGRVSLEFTRVELAEFGLDIQSLSPSDVQNSSFVGCSTGVLVAQGDGSSITNVAFRENSVGLQLNNSAVRVEACRFESHSLYGIDVDSSTAPASLDVQACEFGSNLQAHLRMSATPGNPIQARVRQTNFLDQAGFAPAVILASPCVFYVLDLKGNYWGPVSGPQDIKDVFDGGKACDPGLLEWSDSECDGDPEACDWSPLPW